MPARKSPSARSLELMRKRGYTIDGCQRQLTKFLRRDLFGLFDFVAFNPGKGFVFLQVTDFTSFARHETKWKLSPHLPELLRTPGAAEFIMHSWKRGVTGDQFKAHRAVLNTKGKLPFVELVEVERK